MHHHDIELQLFRQNVIYLYRDPIPTIYSQLVYHKEDTNNLHRIKYWSTLYGLHLEKYLINDDFTEKKTILTYGGLVSRMAEEFSKLTKHLDYSLDISKLQNVKLEVDKEKLKKKTKHDNQVVNLSKNYNNDREYFIEKHSNLVLDSIGRVNDKLTLIIQ